MSFRVQNKYVCYSGEQGVQRKSLECNVILKGSGSDKLDYNAALTALLANLSSTLSLGADTLSLESAYFTEQEGGGGIWHGIGRYSPNTIILAVGQERRTFNSSGGTQHFIVSKESIASFGTSPPNLKQMIGVSEDAPPAGADVVVGVHEFEITRAFFDGDVTQSYEVGVSDITGTTNSSTFRTYPAKSVLFLGGTGGQRGDGTWELTFKFAAAKPRTGITIGDIASINVGAWELLWVYYLKQGITAGAITVPGDIPTWAFVERVYDDSSFSSLGINT